MKRILLALLLLTTCQAGAQIIDAKSLKGPWREVSRIRAGQTVRFRDTLFFELLSSQLCVWGKTSPSAPRLRVKLTGTTLEIGSYEFDILEQSGDHMRLAGQDGVEMEMQRYSKKPVALARNSKINGNTISFRPAAIPKTGNVPDRIEPFVGSWKCYKRSSSKPIDTAAKYRIIRLVEILEQDDMIVGKIYGFEDLENQPSWIVQQYEKGVLSTSGKDERNFRVINCQPNELVIENEGVVYYMNKM